MGQIKSTPAKAIAYIARGEATRDGLYVSTNAAVIDPSDSAAIARAMADTSARVGVTKPRDGSVLAHHVIQSFDPAEKVTAEQAHRIGEKLAEKITGGRYEYVIATHTDKDHVHNHIIFNAVNMDTGRKYRVQKSTIGMIRDASDALCREAHLRVLPRHEGAARGRSFGELYATLRGEGYKQTLRTEVDKAAQRASTWEQFVGELRVSGVEVRQSRGQVSYRLESSGRAVRDWKLGESFAEGAVMARLAREQVNRIDVDRTMIVRQNATAVTVRVPGTRGNRQLTIPTQHIVQHGRTLRAYVPASSSHVLSDRRGNYGETVRTTAGLYRWFSEPKQSLYRASDRWAGRPQDRPAQGKLRTFGQALTSLHQIERSVNARTRWAPDGDLTAGRDAVGAEVTRLRIEVQTQLVALADLMDDPAADQRQIGVLSDALRGLEIQLERVKRDAAALGLTTTTPHTIEQKETTLQDKINSRARELREAQGSEAERHARTERTRAKEEDFIRDRNGGDGDGDDTTPGGRTIADRIADARRQATAPTPTDDHRDRHRTR